MKNHPKTLTPKKNSRFFFLIFIYSIAVGCTNSSKQIDEKTLKTEEVAFSEYRKNSTTSIQNLSPKFRDIRQDAQDKLNKNSIYHNLTTNKVIDQKYLVLLQTIGEGLVNSNNEGIFEITETADKGCKKIPDGHEFVIHTIRLGLFGGLPSEILDVYERYWKEFKIYGTKGDITYNSGGKEHFKLNESFSIAQCLAIIDNKNESVLDAYYKSIQLDLISWINSANNNYTYKYLTDKYSFNDYLKTNYPTSKYYIHYDIAISASSLYQAYDENEVAADDKYQGKNLLISGTIKDIGLDFLDKPYITLRTGDYGVIQCYFEEKSNVKNFRKGEKVQLIGVCSSKTLGNILVQNSSIF